WNIYLQNNLTLINLIEIYGIRSIFSFISIILNITLIYVTIKIKSLHNLCNILIALESFFSILLNLNYFVSFILSLIGHPFIKFNLCFWFMILFIISGNNAQITMVLIGIDRLIAVKMPIL
ncbi:hypothetical protein Mgra_00007575, partial [Meloidogyne graminicola]